MARSRWTLAILFCALGRIWGAPTTTCAGEFTYFHENVMGTSLELRLDAPTEAEAVRAETAVLREIDRLSKIFSTYDPQSEFSRWLRTRDTPVAVSTELLELLAASDRWCELTKGGFDPRVEALSRVWSAAAKRDRLPDPDEIESARSFLANPAWTLDPKAKTATHTSDAPLTLNAIAKGYIVGKACDVAMASQGIQGVLLNVGGDMRVRGSAPRAVAIAAPWDDSETSEPLTTIAVKDRAVATSGRSQRGYRIGGKWYSHIIHPRTGRPVEKIVAATVLARDSTEADALATSLNVLPVEEGLALAARIGAEALLVSPDGKIAKTKGWDAFENAPLLVAQVAKDKEGTWNDEFELAITFELNNVAGARRGFRRQYVAVWVEDKKGFPVRTLLLWGKGQWVRDLRLWTKSDEVRKQAEGTDTRRSTSRPTRPPGKYDVVWDGTDNNGKRLDAGEYTVFIEAAREHGTYQVIRAPVTVAAKPFAEELKGNVELKSASIEYRRKGSGK